MQISERMWSLWPQIIQSFYEWAVDYFDHIAGALENYISKGTEHFLQPTPGYLQQVPHLHMLVPPAWALVQSNPPQRLSDCLGGDRRPHGHAGRGLSMVQAVASGCGDSSIPDVHRSTAAQGGIRAVAAQPDG